MSHYTDAEATRCIALLALETPFTLDDVIRARRESARDWHPDLFHTKGTAAVQRASERMKSINVACDYLEAHFARIMHTWSGEARPWVPPQPQGPEAPPEEQYEDDPYFRAYRQEFEQWAAGQSLSRWDIERSWQNHVHVWPRDKAKWKAGFNRRIREENARRRQQKRQEKRRQEDVPQAQSHQAPDTNAETA